MRICHVTPHLPPDQAANALLPAHLGAWAHARGDQVSYVAHVPRAAGDKAGRDSAIFGDPADGRGAGLPAGRGGASLPADRGGASPLADGGGAGLPADRGGASPLADGGGAGLRAGAPVALPGRIIWVALPSQTGAVGRALRVPAALTALRIARAAWPAVRDADLVHVHSNGLIAEVGALVASICRKPFVLTLYGTEIWHYRPKRPGPDLFTRAYRRAAAVTFYSHGLMDRAIELGLSREDLSVIYPPVAADFQLSDEPGQAEAKSALGLSGGPLLVNVKRLHPLAGQRTLIQAMPSVLEEFPGARLIICGTGPLERTLAVEAAQLGVSSRVTFAGLVDNAAVARIVRAADLFVLPSLLEACPTVALEALACGTPVVSSDNPGGVELARRFGADVVIVAREDPVALASAIRAGLHARRRVAPATTAIIEGELRLPAVALRYDEVYRRALDRGAGPR